MVTDLRITDLCRILRISGIASCFQELEPTQETEEIRSFLLQALETEVALRAERRRLRAIKTAGFPTMKRFDDLDPAMLPDEGRRYLPLLQSLTFLEEHQNILMIGNSGTGKTHLAIAAGICACEQEYRVMFIVTFITVLKHALEPRAWPPTRLRRMGCVIPWDCVLPSQPLAWAG